MAPARVVIDWRYVSARYPDFFAWYLATQHIYPPEQVTVSIDYDTYVAGFVRGFQL